MKDDARALFLFIADGGNMNEYTGMHPNRMEFLYRKWWKKNLLGLGKQVYLTALGRQVAENLRAGGPGESP